MSIESFCTRKKRTDSSSSSSPVEIVSDKIPPSLTPDNTPDTVSGPSRPKQHKPISSETPASIISKLDKSHPIVPILNAYPKTKFGNEKFERSFSKQWYEGRPWLEYIVELDACLCFPCRVYASNFDTPFVRSGFKNWKNAGAGKIRQDKHGNDITSNLHGIAKHSISVLHKEAVKTWEEHKKRASSSQTVNTMLMQRVPEHRTWLETVFHVVRYLAMNGLPFRGDVENTEFSDDEFGGGLYLNTFRELVFPLDDSLKQIALKLPGNAKYTSLTIQNEAIEVLQDILKAKLSERVRKAKTFTLMMDRSSDRCWREIEGIVVRYVNDNGNIEEHAIGVEEAVGRSATGLIEIMTKCLRDLGISLDGVVCQCYDGASVMSGHRGGLQQLLSVKCERGILYVHCFCHRLHLVVTDIIENVLFICEHYDNDKKSL